MSSALEKFYSLVESIKKDPSILKDSEKLVDLLADIGFTEQEKNELSGMREDLEGASIDFLW